MRVDRLHVVAVIIVDVAVVQTLALDALSSKLLSNYFLGSKGF